MRYKFSAQITAANVYDFLLTHTYRTFAGWFSILAGVVAIILGVTSWGEVSLPISMCYLFLGLIAFVYMPALLFYQAKKQMKTVPAYRFPVTYEIGEDGITINQMERKGFVKWEEITKAIAGNSCLLVYLSKANAFLWPKKDMGQDCEAIVEMLRKHAVNGKVRIRL
ncbi:MAG: YcxB family protein [Lachnospiraceae bacterium]|nr:YcxB family protein [Lachnospiraceae bacterium]MDD3615525.1 YcxB family protein [Lachnospiraceae bacterium]